MKTFYAVIDSLGTLVSCHRLHENAEAAISSITRPTSSFCLKNQPFHLVKTVAISEISIDLRIEENGIIENKT